jgi:hypothetical protein
VDTPIGILSKAKLALLILLPSCLLGCSSIQSDTVRTLIEVEAQKISEAKKNSAAFVEATDKAVDTWQNSVKELSKSFQNQRTVDSKHSKVFSSNQNIETKTGVDAHAATYLIGQLYLTDRMGLEQAVLDQFAEDHRALKKLAQQVNDSWTALEKTQKEIAAFSQRTFITTVDANLVRALVMEVGEDSEAIDKILTRSKQVNDAIKKASGLGLLEGSLAGRTQLVSEDVVNLLERVKK